MERRVETHESPIIVGMRKVNSLSQHGAVYGVCEAKDNRETGGSTRGGGGHDVRAQLRTEAGGGDCFSSLRGQGTAAETQAGERGASRRDSAAARLQPEDSYSSPMDGKEIIRTAVCNVE
ncbi:hypothetical protein GBAR_LOCUS31530 [Geodia barretti]|uniref:Uncharacterized protein n=1 Tax=Geodia barretti TaxID=519541 RepID=A0AA35U0K7_GEOBA|nr:hypothetical protein GBAR_LOCUS31530 [Geodia barretti]